MFDRFTDAARDSVVAAQAEARNLGHRYIGTEHLLLGLLGRPDTVAGATLLESGLTPATVRRQLALLLAGQGIAEQTSLDRESLALIGIDLDAVRDAVEASFGPGALDAPRCRNPRRRPGQGHIPFTARTKKVLDLAVRQSRTLNDPNVTTEHLLLALLIEGQGLAVRTLISLDTNPAQIYQDVLTRIRSAA